MTQRLASAIRDHAVVSALAAAVVVSAAVIFGSRLERLAVLIAAVGVISAFCGLGVWLIRDHQMVHWTISSGTADHVRGMDRRITAHSRSIVAAFGGDDSARQSVRANLRALADACLVRSGLPTDPTDRAAAAALGPDLTAYLTSRTAPPLDERQLASFITTLEETA